MSLADLLATQRDEVMRRWRVRISKKLGVGSLERTELEDDLPRFVDELVDVLRAESSGYGEAPETPSAIDHGADRLRLGFDVSEIVREYGVKAGADRSGFGLGLAISKQAVEAHHGTIHVRNVPDKGCVFTIDLPCRRSA